jgi:hypothetical protein
MMSTKKQREWPPPYILRLMVCGAVIVPAYALLLMALDLTGMTAGARSLVEWSCAAALFLILLFWAVRTGRLKARLRATGGLLCPKCGYEMKGLDEVARCPECGRPFDRERDAAYWRRHMDFGGTKPKP